MFFRYYALGQCLGSVVDPTSNFNCRGLTRKIKKKLFQTRSHFFPTDFRARILQNVRHMFSDSELELLLLDLKLPPQAFSVLIDIVSSPECNLDLFLTFDRLEHGTLPSGIAISRLKHKGTENPTVIV